jgi:hypothetical protein
MAPRAEDKEVRMLREMLRNATNSTNRQRTAEELKGIMLQQDDEMDQDHDEVVAAEEEDASKERKTGRQMLQVCLLPFLPPL